MKISLGESAINILFKTIRSKLMKYYTMQARYLVSPPKTFICLYSL